MQHFQLKRGLTDDEKCQEYNEGTGDYADGNFVVKFFIFNKINKNRISKTKKFNHQNLLVKFL